MSKKELTVNEKIEKCNSNIAKYKVSIEKEQSILNELLNDLKIETKPLHEQLKEKQITDKKIREDETLELKKKIKTILG